MGHLNKLEEKYGSKGLSVIGVTSEGADLTDPWIEKHGAKYAYAYDKSRSVSGALGSGFLPSIALIDSTGKVVFKGSTRDFDDSMIERAISGALTTPLFEVEGYNAKMKKALSQGKFDTLIKEIEKLENEESRATLLTAVGGMIDGRLNLVDALFEEGDYLAMKDVIEPLAKATKKLPQGERAEALLDKLGDKQVKNVLRAQEKVRDIVPTEGRISERERNKIRREMEKIIKDLPDTCAARDAKAVLEYI